MKSLNRAILSLSVFAIVALTLHSCGGFFGIDITDQKSIDDNLRSKIEEFIGADAKIIEISLSTGMSDSFSKTIDYAYVHYFEPGSDKILCKCITLGGKAEAKDKSISHEYEGPMYEGQKKDIIKPEDVEPLNKIDLSKIAANVEKAAKMIEAEGNEFSGIGNFVIKPRSDVSKSIQHFTIQSRQGAQTTTKSGRLATEVSFLEFEFNADAEGNVTIIKE